MSVEGKGEHPVDYTRGNVDASQLSREEFEEFLMQTRPVDVLVDRVVMDLGQIIRQIIKPSG